MQLLRPKLHPTLHFFPPHTQPFERTSSKVEQWYGVETHEEYFTVRMVTAGAGWGVRVLCLWRCGGPPVDLDEI